MKKIGIISDTHGYLSDELFSFMDDCDEIWHAGDIGSLSVVDKLKNFKPLRAVYGNIDDYQIRSEIPEIQRFTIDNTDVLIKHIVGTPANYEISIRNILHKNPPKLLVAGHSHILKIMYDKKYDLLFINPGAFGNYGFHTKRTAIKVQIENNNFENLKILEIDRK